MCVCKQVAHAHTHACVMHAHLHTCLYCTIPTHVCVCVLVVLGGVGEAGQMGAGKARMVAAGSTAKAKSRAAVCVVFVYIHIL